MAASLSKNQQMALKKPYWEDPFAVDGRGIYAETDGGTASFFDHGDYQILTAGLTAALDQSDSATAPTAPPSEAEASSLTFDELSALYPGIVWPLFAERIAASTTDDNIAPSSSQAATATETPQGAGPAGLDWWVTPDFDDDPDWLPGGGGVEPLSADLIAASAIDDVGSSSQAATATETPQGTGPAGLDWWVTPDFDDDPDWRPGGIEPASADLIAASAIDDGIGSSSQAATALETPQGTGPAGLDWWITPDFDDDPDWHPGGTGSLSAVLVAASAIDDGIGSSSQAATIIETPQGTGPAGLDWWITPDFDDDPDWQPGGVGSQSADLIAASAADDRAAPALAVADSAQAWLTLPQDETQTSSLTFDEVAEQYPGIVWPANWWLL
jgi:hypothetical protein